MDLLTTKEKWLSVWYTYYINCRRSFFYDGKAKRTNPEYGYIHQARKKELGYLTEMTVDTRHGIITGWTVIQLTRGKGDIILEHLKGQPCKYQEIGLDGGYDIGAVHRGLELLGVQGYTAIREYPNNAMKKDSVMRKKQTALYVDRENI